MRTMIVCAAALACGALVPSLHAQPSIDHVALECIAPGRFGVVLSVIDPENEIRAAKVYFRSSLYPDFYYVGMKHENGRFVGILPQPSPETKQVLYYLEAIDEVFNGVRSAEFGPVVVDPCKDRPSAAYLPSGDPGIVVGATTAGQSALPPGFSAAGIVGTIAATGIGAGVGGGIGTGVVVATAAGAAGVAGTVVAASGGGETTSTPGSAATSSATTTVPPGTSPPGSSSTTTTAAPGPSTTTTTIPGPGTTTTTAPGGTTTSGPPTTTTTTTSPTSTTTIVTTTTTAAPPLNAACFTVQVLAPCQVRVDATCVNLPIDEYEWTLDLNDRWQKAEFPSAPASLVHTFGNCGTSQALQFKLKVRRGAVVEVSIKDVFVTGSSLRSQRPPGAASVAFQSHLSLPPFDDSVRGRVLLEGAAWIVDGSRPVIARSRAAAGENRIEAVLERAGAGPGSWRFDFAGDARFVRGSLRVEQGNVLSIEPASIVFGLGGDSQERLQFTFALEP